MQARYDKRHEMFPDSSWRHREKLKLTRNAKSSFNFQIILGLRSVNICSLIMENFVMPSIMNALLCAPFKLPAIIDKRGYTLKKKSRTWGKQLKTMKKKLPGNTTKLPSSTKGREVTFEASNKFEAAVKTVLAFSSTSTGPRSLDSFSSSEPAEAIKSAALAWEKRQKTRALVQADKPLSRLAFIYSAILVSWNVTQRSLRGTMRDISREKETNADSTLALARLDLNEPERVCCVKKINVYKVLFWLRIDLRQLPLSPLTCDRLKGFAKTCPGTSCWWSLTNIARVIRLYACVGWYHTSVAFLPVTAMRILVLLGRPQSKQTSWSAHACCLLVEQMSACLSGYCGSEETKSDSTWSHITLPESIRCIQPSVTATKCPLTLPLNFIITSVEKYRQ